MDPPVHSVLFRAVPGLGSAQGLEMDRNQLRDDLSRRLRALLEEEAFDLWDLEVTFQSGRTVVQVTVERPGGGVTLDECAYWNRKLGRYLEAENVLPGSYVLEVGSPGGGEYDDPCSRSWIAENSWSASSSSPAASVNRRSRSCTCSSGTTPL